MKLSLRGRGRRLHDNNFLFAEAAAPAARTASNYGEHDEQDDADNNARDRSRVDFAAIVLGLGIAKIATPLVRLLHDDVTTSRVRITLGVQLARYIQSGTRLGRAQVCRTCIPRVRSRACSAVGVNGIIRVTRVRPVRARHAHVRTRVTPTTHSIIVVSTVIAGVARRKNPVARLTRGRPRRSFCGFLARDRRWFLGYSRQRRIRRLERNDR